MQRRRNCKQCSQCHLQKLIPTRKVIKTLFVGLLPKGRRKHEVRFDTKEEDLQVASRRVQIRCFRLKENCQQAILFPDSAVFTLNNCFLKEFEPINKQSCLKYRKD